MCESDNNPTIAQTTAGAFILFIMKRQIKLANKKQGIIRTPIQNRAKKCDIMNNFSHNTIRY